MSDTPRTDAAMLIHSETDRNGGEWVNADFARQLERDHSEALSAVVAALQACRIELWEAQQNIASSVASEREACARICEEMDIESAGVLADAIRARK